MDYGATLNSIFSMVLPFIVLIAISYVFIIKPDKKAKAEFMSMQANLKVNDIVSTRGGLIGKIIRFEDDTVTLEVADRVRVRVLKESITTVRKESSNESAE